MTAPKRDPSDVESTLTRLKRQLGEDAERLNEEGKQVWEQTLRPELDAIIERVKGASNRTEEEIKLQTHLGLMEAKERMHELEPFFESFARDLKDAGTDLRATLDHSRLKAHLAKLDASDVVDKRRQELAATLADARATAHRTAEEARAEIARVGKKLLELANLDR